MIDTIIDVKHDNALDIEKVKEAGIVAVIHKATEGATFKDPKYLSRKQQAMDAGLLWGAYHFSSGVNPVAQAENFLSVEDGTDSRILLSLDWEKSTSGEDMTLAQARVFISTIKEKTGRYPLIYGGQMIRHNVTHQDQLLANCPLWYVRYKDAPEGIPTNTWPTYTLWQYTDGKKGPEPRLTQGSSGADRNRYQGSTNDLRAAWPFTRA